SLPLAPRSAPSFPYTTLFRSPEHASFVVQALWSSQGAVFGAPGWQLPAAHTSPDVQGLPSSQEAVLFACTHPAAGLHESFVQGLDRKSTRLNSSHEWISYAVF